MALASPRLVQLLLNTANRLENSPTYQWGHMGACNCGHLAQEVTQLSKAQIHARAMERYGDWSTQVRDYCPDSGLAIDDIIGALLAEGLSTRDLEQLEWLSDDKVLRLMPADRRHPERNKKDDVVLYLRAWAALLEAEMSLPELLQAELVKV
jgi:hypothetical protein